MEPARPPQKTYKATDTTFTKFIFDIENSGPSGQLPKRWAPQRVRNEFDVLSLVARCTTISVPPVISVGVNEAQQHFLTTSFVQGILLCDVGAPCNMPDEPDHLGHNHEGTYSACQEIAQAKCRLHQERGTPAAPDVEVEDDWLQMEQSSRLPG